MLPLTSVASRFAFYMTESRICRVRRKKVEKMFEISRYLLQELSDLNLTESSNSICRLYRASSAKNASFFLIMNIHLLGEKNPQMLIYAYFAD